MQKQNHRGLGYETNIPAYRKNPVNPIPKHIEIPTDEEISYFLKIYKGIGPYNPEEEWKKKMFNWDLYTNEQENRYLQELKSLSKEQKRPYNESNISAWKKWMTAHNQWISFYEFYYPSVKEIERELVKKFKSQDQISNQSEYTELAIFPSPLSIPTFSPKVISMLSKPNIPLKLQAVRTKGEELVKDICSRVRVNMMNQSSTSKYKWELLDGSTLETEEDFPPWKNIVIKQDGKIFKLLSLQTDESNLSNKESVAATNWTLCFGQFRKISKETYKISSRNGKFNSDTDNKTKPKTRLRFRLSE